MSALIFEALREVDLGSVELVTIQGQRRQVTARPTKIVLPRDVRDELERWSETRACSMNELLNSALVVSLLTSRSKKSGGPGRARTPVFDTMTPNEREDFFAPLLALTGREPGPAPRSTEGGYYEWDARLEATVEVGGGGRRYLVDRVGPGEMLRVRELKGSVFVGSQKKGSSVTLDCAMRRKSALTTTRSGASTVVAKADKEVSVSETSTGQKPVLIMLSGTAGAGKTTFHESMLRAVFPSLLKASASPIEQAETNKERCRLLGTGHSFVYQDTTIDPSAIRDAQQAGFDVKVFYIGTEDPNLNIGRVLLRVSNGGPLAALARIPDDYAQGLKHLRDAKEVADDIMLFDNTTSGRGHRLVAHFQAGRLMKVARPVPKWIYRVFGKEFERLGPHRHS